MGVKVSQRQLKAAQGLTRALGRESIPTESESWEEVMEAVDTLNCDAEDLARLTRERDSLELELRATESVRVKDNEHLLARAEQAEEQLRLANIDATTNEAEANDLRVERDRLREALERSMVDGHAHDCVNIIRKEPESFDGCSGWCRKLRANLHEERR